MGNNHYCVIMAGGIGSRFWPLSRKELPKQFIDFFGTGKTLLQQTYERYRKQIEAENIFVVTNMAYTGLVADQLPELSRDHILAEPTRRNTAPALAWATYHIHTLNPEARVVFTPADHLIGKDEEFMQAIQEGFDFIQEYDRLLCVGIRPTRPETRYGYIQVGDDIDGAFHPVRTFTEKPERELAEIFVESGEFYWNSGIFMGRTATFVEAFHKHVPELASCFETSASGKNRSEEESIEESFALCPNVSIEYGILEKTDNVYVMTCELEWSDLGTWSTFQDTQPKDVNGNTTVNARSLHYDCRGCFIASDKKEKLIVAQGLENYLIIDTGDVLMICPKDDSSMLRKFVNDAQVKMGNEYV